jgi:membrane protein implicated in regulation of membrane protease activity
LKLIPWPSRAGEESEWLKTSNFKPKAKRYWLQASYFKFLVKDFAMSALYKIPRGLLILIGFAILAILVWKTGTDSYFYPTLGIAVLTFIVFVIAIFRTRRFQNETETKEASQKPESEKGKRGPD